MSDERRAVELEVRQMTPARLDALRRFRDARPAKKGSVAACHCRKRGLADFIWKCSDGKERANPECLADWDSGGREYTLVSVARTELTPLGRAVLARFSRNSAATNTSEESGDE